MARAGILYSQVAHAAAQLAGAGKNPTVDNVRQALGGTGSKSTIAPMLKRWKSEHRETVVQAEAGLPAELIHAVKGVYDKLQDDVGQQLKSAREKHQLEQDGLTEQVAKAVAEHCALAEVNAGLVQELQQLNVLLDQLRRDHHAAVVAQTAAQTESAGLQQRLADRAAEVHSLTQQLAQTRTQFEHFQEAAAHQRTEERQAFEQRLARLEHDLSASAQRQAAQQTMLAQQHAELTHLSAGHERSQQAAHAAQTELAASRTERDQLAYQVKELLSARADTQARLDTVQQALAEANVMGASAQQQAAMLAEHLARAEDKLDKADQERTLLVQKLTERQTRVRTERPRP